jgi:tRNA pseudouridine55 synthase
MNVQNMKRDISGILLLDKPLEISSNSALQKVKRLFSATKAGHTGSLDPLASGMLPICFGEAAKFSQHLLDADKHYSVIAQLGIKTSTADAEGEIISQRHVEDYPQELILATLEKYKGKIKQVPPMHSALKFQGKPLYQLARKGQTIERAAREVHIYKIDLIEINNDQLKLNVHCSKGTYIRTLIEDIGESLGCGAHVAFLRRNAIAHFNEQQMITFTQLQEAFEQEGFNKIDQYLLPINGMLIDYPTLSITEEMAFCLTRGQSINIQQQLIPGQMIQLLIDNKNFIGIGEVLEDNKIIPKRLIRT